jgi:hypothetical protein
MGDALNLCKLLIYFITFVFFVNEKKFLGLTFGGIDTHRTQLIAVP